MENNKTTHSGHPEMGAMMEELIREQQKKIVGELEKIDGKKFLVDTWERPGNSGGGISCVLQEGNVFEKAGVNISMINGAIPAAGVKKMKENHASLNVPEGSNLPFKVWGLSMIVHPRNPMAPTVHMNYRYFETQDSEGNPQSWWFGGGADLTPCYLFEEDAVLFHQELKNACDRSDPTYYARFKKWCDGYFRNTHRNESRGIGGIFFDDIADRPPLELFSFVKDCFAAFLNSYIPITNRRINMEFTPEQKNWQQIRRGRYVEFNLVHDRGTAFGLQTPNARIESILVSLPLTASWYYDHHPEPGSEEQKLLDVLITPIEWV